MPDSTIDDVDVLDLEDLELDELTVTSMRDTVNLPETAASCQCSCCDTSGNCSCCVTN